MNQYEQLYHPRTRKTTANQDLRVPLPANGHSNAYQRGSAYNVQGDGRKRGDVTSDQPSGTGLGR